MNYFTIEDNIGALWITVIALFIMFGVAGVKIQSEFRKLKGINEQSGNKGRKKN